MRWISRRLTSNKLLSPITHIKKGHTLPAHPFSRQNPQICIFDAFWDKRQKTLINQGLRDAKTSKNSIHISASLSFNRDLKGSSKNNSKVDPQMRQPYWTHWTHWNHNTNHITSHHIQHITSHHLTSHHITSCKSEIFLSVTQSFSVSDITSSGH